MAKCKDKLTHCRMISAVFFCFSDGLSGSPNRFFIAKTNLRFDQEGEKMSNKQKKTWILAGAFTLAFGIAPAANAMHIMEGYLPGGLCIAWGVLCIPFLAAGFLSMKKT